MTNSVSPAFTAAWGSAPSGRAGVVTSGESVFCRLLEGSLLRLLQLSGSLEPVLLLACMCAVQRRCESPCAAVQYVTTVCPRERLDVQVSFSCMRFAYGAGRDPRALTNGRQLTANSGLGTEDQDKRRT